MIGGLRLYNVRQRVNSKRKKGPHPWSGQLVDCRRLSELQLLQGFLQSLNLIILRLDVGVQVQILYLQLCSLLLQMVQMALRAGGAGSSSTTGWPLSADHSQDVETDEQIAVSENECLILRLPDLHLRRGPFSYFRRCRRLESRCFGDPDRRPSGGQLLLGLEGLDDLGGHGGEVAVPRAAPSRRWQSGWCTCREAHGAG